MEATFASAHEMTFRQNENNLLILVRRCPIDSACMLAPAEAALFIYA